jgi:NADH:ubiquinone oxidoreductase subunit 4 (subunit M)
MLIGILFIFSQVNTTDIRFLVTLDIELNRQLILWLSFFIAFAIKVPMIPFHI